MEGSRMGSDQSSNTSQRLRDVRQTLLRLHKTLLESERESYERERGRVDNSYHVLKLVMHDPRFAWLHSLSELIVRIDEMLDAEEPPGEGDANSVIEETRTLLTPSEAGGEFQMKYFAALQQSPDIVLAHAEVVRVLGKRPSQVH
ncbi:MAG: hypothetical protein ACREBG_14805 [Pyrinomonadaceae bacterium]